MKNLIRAAALLLVTGPLTANANLITNGGFESGLTGWSCTGADSCSTTTGAHSGAAAQEGFDNVGFATLSQTISTVAGATYDFSFWSSVFVIHPGNILRYSLDSGPAVTVPQSTGGFTWENFTDTFAASGATASIAFFFETDGGTGTWRIDDVSVTLSALPVSEPASLALLGLALVGVGLRRRRTR